MRRLPIEPVTDAASANKFLLGIIFNQTIRAEQAWKAPAKIMQRLGTDKVEKIAKKRLQDSL